MNKSTNRGFTLIELLVVIALISLLVVMVVPMFADMTRKTKEINCQSNLRGLAQVISQRPGGLPYPRDWHQYAAEAGSGEVLTCPADPTDYDSIPEQDDVELTDLHLIQIQGGQVRVSPLQEVIETGTSSQDSQVKRTTQADGKTAGDGQCFITVGGTGDECAITRITYGGRIKIESLIHNRQHGCASTHWICKGDNSPEWRANLQATWDSPSKDSNIWIMRLQGVNYQEKAPDYEMDYDLASYGMSDAVNVSAPSPGQLMLVEWKRAVARVRRANYSVDEIGDDNDDEYGCLRTRHFERANYATTDGMVRGMTRPEMQYEYDSYEIGSHYGIFAP